MGEKNYKSREFTKWVCEECDATITDKHMLKAENPFGVDGIYEDIYGCPECKSVNCFREACDIDGCWRNAVCGSPTENGYKRMCWIHGKAYID